jgi:hypothetical protein
VLSGPFKTLSRCNILNIHGGLHLYKTADYEIEKRPATAAGMIDAIVTISQGDRFPVYVAEGTSSAKLSRINEVLSLHLQAKRTDSLAEMNGKLSYFQKSNGSRIDYTLVDAESTAVWK